VHSSRRALLGTLLSTCSSWYTPLDVLFLVHSSRRALLGVPSTLEIRKGADREQTWTSEAGMRDVTKARLSLVGTERCDETSSVSNHVSGRSSRQPILALETSSIGGCASGRCSWQGVRCARTLSIGNHASERSRQRGDNEPETAFIGNYTSRGFQAPSRSRLWVGGKVVQFAGGTCAVVHLSCAVSLTTRTI
jgi:hypothetical protein